MDLSFSRVKDAISDVGELIPHPTKPRRYQILIKVDTRSRIVQRMALNRSREPLGLVDWHSLPMAIDWAEKRRKELAPNVIRFPIERSRQFSRAVDR